MLEEQHIIFFDERWAKDGSVFHIGPGEVFYHGFIGSYPRIHNNQTLWTSRDFDEACTYSKNGWQPGQSSGVIKLVSNESVPVVNMQPEGLQFLSQFEFSTHADFSDRLHTWGVMRGLKGILNHGTEFAWFEPEKSFSLK